MPLGIPLKMLKGQLVSMREEFSKEAGKGQGGVLLAKPGIKQRLINMFLLLKYLFYGQQIK